MNHSGKNDPCPICGRDTDDKCRWNDNFYFCYHGSIFGPPDVPPGGTIEANGLSLACLTQQGGFAGASAVFALDREQRPQGRSGWAIRQRKERAESQEVLRSKLEREIPRLRKILRSLQNHKVYFDCTIDELQQVETLSKYLIATVDSLIELFKKLRPNWERSNQQLKILQDTRKSAMLISNDIHGFQAHYLHR